MKDSYIYIIKEFFFDWVCDDIINAFKTQEEYERAMNKLKQYYIDNERIIEDEWDDYFCVQDRCDVKWYAVKLRDNVGDFIQTLQ